MTIEELAILILVVLLTVSVISGLYLAYQLGRLRECLHNKNAWDKHLEELDELFEGRKLPLFIETTPPPELVKFSVAISQAMNEAMAKDEYYEFKPEDIRKVIDEKIAEKKW